MQYKTLFVVPNRVQLGLVVATQAERARVQGENPYILALFVFCE